MLFIIYATLVPLIEQDDGCKCQKFDKMLFIIYVAYEPLTERNDGCKKILKHYLKKVVEHILSCF